MENKQQVLEACGAELSRLYDWAEALPAVPADALDTPKTAIFVIDMINGFAKQGALYSPRVEALIGRLDAFLSGVRHAQKIAFADCHEPDSLEFAGYPPHCVAGTAECEVVPELAGYMDLVIPKNTTNGFLEMGLVEWLHNNLAVDQYVVVGDCTDICVYQFAVGMRTFFNHNHMDKRVIVPVDLVDTYDIPGVHSAPLMHLTALCSMAGNGVELVRVGK